MDINEYTKKIREKLPHRKVVSWDVSISPWDKESGAIKYTLSVYDKGLNYASNIHILDNEDLNDRDVNRDSERCEYALTKAGM